MVVCCQSLIALDQEWKGGWSQEIPYQYEATNPAGLNKLTGLDIEVMRAVAREAGYAISFQEKSWEQTLLAVEAGRLDFGLAATPNEARHDWAWFSLPYRTETILLVTPKGQTKRWAAGSPTETLRKFFATGGRLAVMRGFYYGPVADSFLKDPAHQAQLVSVDNNAKALDAMLSGRADAFLADQLAAVSVAAQVGALSMIDAVPGIIDQSNLSFIFSKKTVSAETLAAFDDCLASMKETGKIAEIARHYLVPQLLLITMETVWFRMFEVIGTIAFAISGVIIARRERYDLVGAVVLAALPAMGGGVMRDVISGRAPIAIIQTPSIILLVLGTVAAGFLFFAIHDYFGNGRTVAISEPESSGLRWISMRGALEVSDAIGLATFTIIGVMVAVEQRCEPLWLWGPIMATLTASGGGVLRDVLRSQSDIPTLKGSIYPEIALVCGLVYSLIILAIGPDLNVREMLLLTILVMLTAFVSRILVVHFRLRSIYLGRAPARNPVSIAG